MEPLLDQMNQLGPWGVVLGAALVVLLQRLGVKLPAPLSPPAPVPPTPEPPKPVDPKPDPAMPKPEPAPVVPNRPVLDGLLKVLLAILESQAKKEGRPVEAVVADALPQLVREGEVK